MLKGHISGITGRDSWGCSLVKSPMTDAARLETSEPAKLSECNENAPEFFAFVQPLQSAD